MLRLAAALYFILLTLLAIPCIQSALKLPGGVLPIRAVGWISAQIRQDQFCFLVVPELGNGT